ncbi:MAG: cupin domain-containing protein [Bryobacteraceae bacterium]|nr:cupin domain-containing protein [Bryobacteraceae bacterium]
MSITEPYVLTNQNAPAFWLIDNLWLPLATGVLTGNQFTLIEQVCATGIGGPPTHTHTQDEGFYVLEGGCTFQAGGETVKAGPGTFVFVPRLTDHSFVVDKPNTRVLNFYTPAGFEMILMSIAAPAQERTPPPPNAVPIPPRSIVAELSREYGQEAVLGLPFADMPDEKNSVTKASPWNRYKPYGASAADAPTFWQQQILWSVLASVDQTGGSFSLLEEVCPRLSGPPPHTHDQDEAIYVIDGQITFQAGNLVSEAPAGAFVYIPRQTVHSFRVDSETARILNFYLPGGFEQVITTQGQPASSRTVPPPEPKEKINQNDLAALLQATGMRLVAVPDFLRQ